MDIRPGTVLEGPAGAKVVIDSLLGRGGFGQVFAAQLPDGTRVAVKTVLTAALDDAALRTLQNEAKHATSIVHANVVHVLHVSLGTDDSELPPYFVMEFVQGGDLRKVLDEHKVAGTKLSADELRAMYLQIAEGMAAINARVVHRDLKPENVLVDGKAGSLKIADFGLAKLADAATRSETFKGWGTRPYQAPEAFDYGPNTPAMDVYAAGVMFFEMATLAWPVQPKAGDNSPLAWRNAHLLQPPGNLRVARPDLPEDLIQLILLMLHKDPSRRPSWAQIIDRLKKDTAPVSGRPDVSKLVQKATDTFEQTTAQEAEAREEREREAELRALCEQAFQEPVDVLRALVEAFNEASEIGKLTITQSGSFSAEVKGTRRGVVLVMTGRIIDDLDARDRGLYRILGTVAILPAPSASSQEELLRDRDSFGSFNLVYRLPTNNARFGTWSMLRFEHNPLSSRASYPRWFAIELDELPRQLRLLNALGLYQHEQQELSDDWFRALLSHLV